MMQVYDRVLATGGLTTLFFLGAVLCFALIVLGLLDTTRQRVGARIALRLNRLLAPAVTDLSIGQTTTAGDVSRAQAVRDLDTLRQALVSPPAYAVLDTPWTIVFVLACFLIHPLIGAVTLGGAVVLFVIALAHEHAVRPKIARTTDLAPRYYAAATIDRASAEAMRALGMRAMLRDLQLERRQELVAAQTEILWTQSAYGSASKVWRLLLQSGVLALGAYLLLSGRSRRAR